MPIVSIWSKFGFGGVTDFGILPSWISSMDVSSVASLIGVCIPHAKELLIFWLLELLLLSVELS